jgi:hypothetical protein
MKIERKTFAIGGFVLVGLLIVASIFVSPSAFMSVGSGTTQGLTCVELGTSDVICEGAVDSDYWKENTFSSKALCDDAHDEFAKPCTVYGCTCKYIPE